MRNRTALFSGAILGALCALAFTHALAAQSPHDPVVRLAELEIDPAHLDAYKALLTEEIAASIRVEPGVLTLYAVSLKDHPNQIRLFEMYKDHAAYLSHLKAPHFLKYKTQTDGMVKSLTLLEADPVLLGSKFK
jgi:quinol monooxygenase YgiN